MEKLIEDTALCVTSNSIALIDRVVEWVVVVKVLGVDIARIVCLEQLLGSSYSLIISVLKGLCFADVAGATVLLYGWWWDLSSDAVNPHASPA